MPRNRRPFIGTYILENGKIRPEPDTLKWGAWYETAERRVERTTINDDVDVSTVFLGIDNNFGGDGPPILFETLVFGGEYDGWQRRCATLGEAKVIHFQVVEALRRGEKPEVDLGETTIWNILRESGFFDDVGEKKDKEEDTVGIDVYLRWEGQTEEERKAQYTGYSIEHGHVGYLREAYHGGPYATQVLAPEAFEDDAPAGGAPIPAATLRSRMPEVRDAVIERAKEIYKEDLDEDSAEVQAFENFVRLAEQKERDTGQMCRVYASY
jgi:hypothetical protein